MHHAEWIPEIWQTFFFAGILLSIAILPFDDLSPDESQQYLGDVVSETITTTLAKVPDLLVIARHSTETYKGKPVKLQTVAKELVH